MVFFSGSPRLSNEIGRVRCYISLVHLCCLPCLIVLLLKDYAPRYLLPLSGFALIMVFFVLRERGNRLQSGLLGALIVLGMASSVSFKDHRFENGSSKQLKRVIRQLESKETFHVFCQGAMLQWQLMFYSEERLVARYYYNTDRYPSYVQQVNAALEDPAQTVALVGPYTPNLPRNAPNLTTYGVEYYSYLYPSKRDLENARFRFE